MATASLTPLPINTGGNLPHDQVVGRDILMATVLERLGNQSVIIGAERRMGKTSLLRKLEAEANDKAFVICYRSVENTSSPTEFVEAIIEMVGRRLSPRHKIVKGLRNVLRDVGLKGIDIKGVTLDPAHAVAWKPLLERVIETIDRDKTKPVVLLIDELPYMLQKIAAADSPAIARDVLDTLRALRANHPGVRMLFSGSIGLHHALRQLHDPTIAWQPVNDMAAVSLGPLAPEDAINLAKRLLLGKNVATDTLDAVAARMAELVEGVPFYIHHLAAGVVEQFGRTADVPTPADIDALVEKAVLDPADPWQLAHYVTRLKDYFEEDHEVVAIILDLIARSDDPIGFDDLTKQLHAKKAKTPSDDEVRALLDLLERDHYLVKAGAGRVRFRLDIIRKAWRAKRYLDR